MSNLSKNLSGSEEEAIKKSLIETLVLLKRQPVTGHMMMCVALLEKLIAYWYLWLVNSEVTKEE